MMFAMNSHDNTALKKAFADTESMMDALMDRVMARDGIWYKTQLADQYKGRVDIGELESLCRLLVTADSVRFELELLEEITNEDADRFDDKVFLLAQIAYAVAGDLEHKHPHKVKAVREALDELMPKEDEEDEA